MARYYLDSSAAFKLAVTEPESAALNAFLDQGHDVVTSRLTVLEVGRAVRRSDRAGDARLLLGGLWERFVIVELSEVILDAAAKLRPLLLRSLDAIQLASALSVREDLTGLVAYDRRLLEAAEAAGLRTWSPL